VGPVVVLIVLSVSILLQIASAVTALSLIRVSGYLRPWLFISTAIVLMAVRRIISFWNLVANGTATIASLGPELVALLISVLMLTGLALFRPTFQRIRATQHDSERQIAEGEMLVRESRHHIKNDLHMLAALVRMQMQHLPDDRARDVLRDLELRIRSFAFLHDEIYASPDSPIRLDEYLGRLANAIHAVHGCGDRRIGLDLRLEPLSAERKEVLHCGLLLNEALTNAYKHAFPDALVANPRVTVVARRVGDRRMVRVTDNGVGFPTAATPAATNSYGLALIRAIGEETGTQTSVVSPAVDPDAPEGSTASVPGTSVTLLF